MLLQALTHVSTTYPGFLALPDDARPAGGRDARAALADARPAPAGHRGAVAAGADARRPRACATSCRRTSGWSSPTSSARCRAGRQPHDQGLHLIEAGERVLSGPARPGRHRQREHGPRPGLAAARHRPRAGAGAAGAEPAAGDARRLVRPRRRPGRPRGGADLDGVDRHVPPALPRAVPGCRRCWSCSSSTRQPAVGGLPAAADADRPARHPEHLAHGPSAPAAGPRWSRRCGWPTRSPSAPCSARRTAPGPGPAGATRSRSSAPSCTPRCATSPRRSATTTTSRRPRSSLSLPRQQAGRERHRRGGAMTRYRIEHVTRYDYDADVTGSFGQFHLTPRDLDWQQVLEPRGQHRARSPRRCSRTPTCTGTPSPRSTSPTRTPSSSSARVSVVDVVPPVLPPRRWRCPGRTPGPPAGGRRAGRLGGDRLHLRVALRRRAAPAVEEYARVSFTPGPPARARPRPS